MNKRWQISTDNATWLREVLPVNGSKIAFSETRDRDSGQAFFRKTMTSSLLFMDTPTSEDYTYFRSFERTPSRRCATIYIRLQFQCSGTWTTWWTGQFSTGSGKWNLHECWFEVKPETLDKYTCLLGAQSTKRNVLQVEPVTANVYEFPSLEFILCEWSGGAPTCEIPASYAQVRVWTPISPFQLVLAWREFNITECVGGNPVTPPGTGWTMDVDSCDTDGTSRWYRTPVIPYTFGDPQFFLDGDGFPEPPPDTCLWLKVGEFNFSVNPPGIVPFYICPSSGTPTEIDRARKLEDVADYLVEQMGCGLAGVRSDLFDWNAVGDTDGYVAGFDYVTGREAEVNSLLIVQNTDAKDPGASNPATIGEWSFKELVQFMQVMQCLWYIDSDNYVRFEHWTHFARQQGLSISEFTKVNQSMTYEHMKSNVPRLERIAFSEALSRDFVGKDIVYSGPCVASDGEEKDYEAGNVITDVTFVLSDPGSIPKKGFVILASKFNGTDYDVNLVPGAITGNTLANGTLSTANIMRDYWTWNRYLPSAEMNGVQTVFDGTVDNISQSDVRVSMCCKMIRFDASKSVATQLGEALGGIEASVEDVSYNISLDRVELSLTYPYR